MPDDTTYDGREDRFTDRHDDAAAFRAELASVDEVEGEARVDLDDAHLSLLRDAVLRPAREGTYRPPEWVHTRVLDALDRHGYGFEGYRDVVIDVDVSAGSVERRGEARFRVDVSADDAPDAALGELVDDVAGEVEAGSPRPDHGDEGGGRA